MLGELLEGKLHEQFLWGGAGNGRGSSAPRQSLTRQTDLLSLKKTLRLAQLTCTTPQMVDKEIEIAITSYNLVRTVIYHAAQQVGVAPRTFSFTRVRNLMNVYGPKIAAAKSQQEADELVALMLHYVKQAKLYQRKRPTYPRQIWHSSKPFPRRKSKS